MTITEIKKMSTIERLRAMEELWDALCHEDKEIEQSGTEQFLKIGERELKQVKPNFFQSRI